MNISSTLAKTEDGTVQINFAVPWDLVKTTREKVLTDLAKDVEVPGFRKGKAPLAKTAEKIPQNTIIEKTLTQLLPKALGDAITEHKLRPAIYPKFEVVSAKENEDWQIRAVTCELPGTELGDYKNTISSAGKAGSDSRTKEEKEQIVIKTLLESIKVKVPKLLLDEEVNVRLSNLLARIEKLGLSLETYLGSVGKTPESLRQEYEKQAESTISLELILNKIAEKEGINISDKETDEALKTASTDPKLAGKPISEEQKRIVRAVLARRTALDSLTSLL